MPLDFSFRRRRSFPGPLAHSAALAGGNSKDLSLSGMINPELHGTYTGVLFVLGLVLGVGDVEVDKSHSVI